MFQVIILIFLNYIRNFNLMLMLIYILISQINFDTCRYFSDIYIYIYMSLKYLQVLDAYEKFEKSMRSI